MGGDRESEYMEKLGQGDHKSFDALFMLYHPRVKNFLLGFIKDEEEACDMNSLKAYLYRKARNMIYDYYEHSLVKESYEQKQQSSSNEYTDLIEEELYAKE